MIDYVKTKYHKKFHFYINDNIIGLSLRMYGEYTETEIDMLKNYLNKKESIVFDIGGNIGVHTVAFAHYAKHVYSFEPNNKNYSLLEQNTKHLKNVTLYREAISDTSGTSHISDFDFLGMGNFGECKLGTEGQQCKTVRLDDLKLPSPDIIKIDVEGHELSVFNGAKNTITNSKPVIFYESMHGSGFDLIYDFLKSLNYTIYYYPSPNYNPRNFNKNPFNIFGDGGVLNCIALPAERGTITGLPEMMHRNDNYEIALDRYFQTNKR